jgi:hypothetical protein
LAFHSLLWGCHGLSGHTEREVNGAFSFGGFHITLVILLFLDNLKCVGLPKYRVLFFFLIGLYYNVYDRIYKKKKAGFSLEPFFCLIDLAT